jgi:energy-coupling factor transporter ATP-binding protein EcfA2
MVLDIAHFGLMPGAQAVVVGPSGCGKTTLLSLLAGLLPMKLNASVAAKNTAAATPVDLERKFEDPLAPNRLPDAPEPKAAPISAPLPCCKSTKPMIISAVTT